MKAYKFILKVRKFQLPTVYSFSTVEGETWLWVDSAAHPGLIGLTDVMQQKLRKRTNDFLRQHSAGNLTAFIEEDAETPDP